jgi:hypothetical protein
MSLVGKGGLGITLPWGDQDRTFRLRIGEWRKIEAKCNAGPEEIAARLSPSIAAMDSGLSSLQAANLGMVGKWRVDDVREVILQGLLGGDDKMGPVEAAQLIKAWVDERPLRENVFVAYAICMASISGLNDDAPGEQGGEGVTAQNPSPTAEPAGATSTDEQPAPASRRSKRTK